MSHIQIIIFVIIKGMLSYFKCWIIQSDPKQTQLVMMWRSVEGVQFATV